MNEPLFPCTNPLQTPNPPFWTTKNGGPKISSKRRFNAHPVLRQGRACARGGGGYSQFITIRSCIIRSIQGEVWRPHPCHTARNPLVAHCARAHTNTHTHAHTHHFCPKTTVLVLKTFTLDPWQMGSRDLFLMLIVQKHRKKIPMEATKACGSLGPIEDSVEVSSPQIQWFRIRWRHTAYSCRSMLTHLFGMVLPQFTPAARFGELDGGVRGQKRFHVLNTHLIPHRILSILSIHT